MGEILLIILGVVVFVGIIRVIFGTYTTFFNSMMELFLLDWLGDLIVFVIECIINIGDDSD